MKTRIWTLYILLGLSVSSANQAHSQPLGSKYFLGTSAFMLVNLDTTAEEPPQFYQLNFGYQLSPKDTLSLELITWRYYAPLGAPIFGDAAKAVDRYPGSVRSLGAALAYQRFIWRGFYAAVHTAFFRQNYLGLNGAVLKNGFQLFVTTRLGYHISFGRTGFYLEPSFAMTSWPVNTGLPSEFHAEERKWKGYQFEPGLHLGWVF
jgi:hypothetical protein